MDPAGIGALLGFGLLFGCFLLYRICEIYDKRKKNIYAPLLQAQNQEKYIGLTIRKPMHWKLKNLNLPTPIPTIKLSSLSSTTSISTSSLQSSS